MPTLNAPTHDERNLLVRCLRFPYNPEVSTLSSLPTVRCIDMASSFIGVAPFLLSVHPSSVKSFFASIRSISFFPEPFAAIMFHLVFRRGSLLKRTLDHRIRHSLRVSFPSSLPCPTTGQALVLRKTSCSGGGVRYHGGIVRINPPTTISINNGLNCTARDMSAARKHRRNKQFRKRHNTKSRNEDVERPVFAKNGRLIMTKERVQPFYQSLRIQPTTAREILHLARHKMMFEQRMTHVVTGSKHDQMFVATTITAIDAGLLQRIPGSAATITTKDNGTKVVELVATGMARRKRDAELFAVVDLIALLHGAGIDVRNPPDLKALHKAAAAERFQADLRQAKSLLELCGVSNVFFHTETKKSSNTSVSDVTLFVHDQALAASGTGNSKAEAESRALIAAAGKPLEEIIGKRRLEEYNALIQKSPAQHVAALSLRPLPDESIDQLMDCTGDHVERMKQHEKEKAEFARNFFQRKATRTSKVHTTNKETINAAFVDEENARATKVSENLEGKQAMIKSARDALPIKTIRQDLLDALRTNQVVVVSGGTGSGKSTQCPQYILEDAILNGRGAETRIVVTQPRRIAAISVAERVAAERDERLGNSVGYAVRFNRELPREAGGSIEFVTTGVLLRRLVNDPTLEGVSHVLIDEVHERDVDTDFLLVLLKDLLTKKPQLRVLLMSATLDADSFGTYFSQITGHVPVMSVPTQPRYPVEMIYLEETWLENRVARKALQPTMARLSRWSCNNLPSRCLKHRTSNCSSTWKKLRKRKWQHTARVSFPSRRQR